MKLCSYIFLFLFVVALNIEVIYGQSLLLKKQEEKKVYRWTLFDWFFVKDRKDIISHGFAYYNSAVPLENYLSIDRSNYELRLRNLEDDTTANYYNHRILLGSYFYFLGLEGQYERANETYGSWIGMAHLRVIGVASQGSNVTFQYGIRNINFSDTEEIANQFWGVSASIYVISNFGFEGLYRSYFPNPKKVNSINRLTAEVVEAGAFIDLFYWRFYGTWFSEVMFAERDFEDYKQTRQGTRFGLKIFF